MVSGLGAFLWALQPLRFDQFPVGIITVLSILTPIILLLTIAAFVVLIVLLVTVLRHDSGLLISRVERLLPDVDQKEDFLQDLQSEAARRGITLTPPASEAEDLSYEDFFNRVGIYAEPEAKGLRYGYTIHARILALLLGVFLLVFFFIGGVIIFLLWYLRYSSIKEGLSMAGEAAAVRG